MIDSSIKNPGETEYDKQNRLQHQKTQVWPLIVNHGKVRKIHWSYLEHNFTTWCCSQFCLSYSTSPRFFTLESIISKSVSVGNFFVMDRFNWKRQWQKEVSLTSNFSAELGFFDVVGNFNLIFDFPKAFYIRIYHFRNCFN